MAYEIETSAKNQADDLEVIDLSALRKKRFRINLDDGDDNRILALNVSDIGVVNRLSEGYERLTKLDAKVATLGSTKPIEADDSDEAAQTKIREFTDKLKEIDSEMRSVIDYIFDSNVCEVCCPYGSMYDPVNGKLRYEHIIDALMNLYSTSLASEMEKTKKKIKSHTAKYTGK